MIKTVSFKQRRRRSGHCGITPNSKGCKQAKYSAVVEQVDKKGRVHAVNTLQPQQAKDMLTHAAAWTSLTASPGVGESRQKRPRVLLYKIPRTGRSGKTESRSAVARAGWEAGNHGAAPTVWVSFCCSENVLELERDVRTTL